MTHDDHTHSSWQILGMLARMLLAAPFLIAWARGAQLLRWVLRR